MPNPGPPLRFYCINISKNFLSFDTAKLELSLHTSK